MSPKAIIILVLVCLVQAGNQPRNLRVEDSGVSIGPICGLCLGTVGVLEQTYRFLPTTMIRNILKTLCIRKSTSCELHSQKQELV